MLSITPKAKDYITEKVLEQDKTYAYLSIKGGGCTGFEYEWTFTDDTSVGKVIEDVLVVDKLAELYIYGSEVDFIEEFGNSSLVIRNPNATATCGCGESFAV